MKFECDKSELVEAISGVSRAVTTRSSVPALEGILFDATGDALILTAYDLEMAIITEIPARVYDAGRVVLSAKLIGALTGRLPGARVTFDVNEENDVTNITCGSAEYVLAGIDANEYPELPSQAFQQASATNSMGISRCAEMPGQLLKEMIDTTIYAVAQDDRKPANSGEKFFLEDNKLTLVALDGFRLAVCEREVPMVKHADVIVPGKAMNEVGRLIGDSEDNVIIDASRRFIVFTVGKYTVMSRLLDDVFLDYTKTISPEHITRVTVEVKPFVDAIERASLMITERMKNPLRVSFDGALTIRCQTEVGKVTDVIDCEFEGRPMEVGFNNRYLLDALRNARCDKVVIELNGTLAPVKILPAEGNAFTFLVMPVRFKND